MSAPRDRKMEYETAFCPACQAETKHHRSTPYAMWTCENFDNHPLERARRTTTIYVAGASAELERAEAVQARLGEPPLSLRYSVTKDWTKQVRAERVEQGKADHELGVALQKRIVNEDLVAVFNAAIVWLLLPPRDIHTVGMWVELGAAYIKRSISQQLAANHSLGVEPTPFILSSGGESRLFSSDVDLHFAEDGAVLQWLQHRGGE